MAGSLQDQLLKTGLSNKQKANDAKTQKHKQSKKQRKSNEVSVDQNKLDVEKVRQEKIERDQLLNQKKKQEAESKAVRAQVTDMVTQAKVEKGNGDVAYNFVHEKKVKKLYVTQDVSEGLTKGQLAIISIADSYELVPTAVAEKIRQRDEGCVIVCNENVTDVDDDDPYADFQIPDDLMW
ncbi:MAG: nucleoprotein/polynucleotide-associated enzyme [Moraxellaceae bacterium]|nr:MAG: nucleoprotein/polynucleotide-associated enzyme [Moraxellaceae bacterium]